MLSPDESDFESRLAMEVERIRASDVLGRSGPIHRLFNFLVQQAGQGTSPKEFEIANQVFGKDGTFDVGQDASIRVYIHRLRKRLDEFYSAHPDGADRLSIPRGTYKLILEPVSASSRARRVTLPPPIVEEPALPEKQGSPVRSVMVAAGLVALALAAALAGYEVGLTHDYPRRLAETLLWHPFTQSRARSLFVMGDQPLPSGHPHVLSTGSAQALAGLVPVVNALAQPETGTPQVITVSRMSPDIVKDTNLVYIGTLAQLGLLRDVVFEHSRLDVPLDQGPLIDRISHRQFVSDVPNGDPRQLVSYGYLACMYGPSGNRIIVIAGTSDAPLVQMAEIVADADQLKALSDKGGGAFEALYSVSTLNGVNVGRHLQLIRPLPGGVTPS